VFVPAPSEEEFNNLIARYESLSMRVEPLSFQRELARVRNAMFDYLGVPGRRHASPETSSVSAA
jgi:hypothetical protein